MTRLINSKAVILIALSSLSANAAPIAIIDSGTDMKHSFIKDKAWTKSEDIESPFKNDIHGWNFAENNNQVIDYKYLGTFSSDVTKYFEIQLKQFNGTATEADKAWVKAKKGDEAFIKELMKFANFMHGTHVAGIAAQDTDDARIMAAKIIPTEVKDVDSEDGIEMVLSVFRAHANWMYTLSDPEHENSGMDDLLMKLGIQMVVGQQNKTLNPVGAYVNVTKMKVANCSFGVGMAQAKMVAGALAKALLKRDLNDDETLKYAKMFMDELIGKGSTFVTAAPNTLFVVAAGNDGLDNDSNGTYPANLRLANSITVAATHGLDKIAVFSNYGITKVDVAAPGVGIISSIPTPAENETLPVSGTSQASPFVANLAGRISDINPLLTPEQVKQIIMQTVDKKAFLADKVVSGGIANVTRALEAADLSIEMDVDSATQEANDTVQDQRDSSRWSSPLNSNRTSEGEVLPLPSLIQIVRSSR